MRKRKFELSAKSESRQREIARRLKLGLPLTGLLAATLFCGCDEYSGHTSGVIMTRVDSAGAAPPAIRRSANDPTSSAATARSEYDRLKEELFKIEKVLNDPANRPNEYHVFITDGIMVSEKEIVQAEIQAFIEKSRAEIEELKRKIQKAERAENKTEG